MAAAAQTEMIDALGELPTELLSVWRQFGGRQTTDGAERLIEQNGGGWGVG